MMENRWNSNEILERIAKVKETIAAAAVASGRVADDIALMAVTKTVPSEFVNLVFDAGVSLFGENRAQELCEKYAQYEFDSSCIHFIGGLQTNKVRQIIDKVNCIQSVDSLHLAQEISCRAIGAGKTMQIMLEVNIAAEATKSGVLPQDLERLVQQTAVLPNILVSGLMTIPPADQKSEGTRRCFDQMHKLFVDIKHKKIDNVTMEHLSMGMSADYALAIAAGANLVRVGSGVFGSRSYPNIQ